MIGIFLDLNYHVLYAKDGEDYVVLDVFSTLFLMVSECMMTTLLLMLANGWMTRFGTYDIEDGMETYAPLMAFVVLVHVMFGALAFIDKDKDHKYHDFQGWVGFGLIAVKFIITGIYLYFYSYCKPLIKKNSKEFYS